VPGWKTYARIVAPVSRDPTDGDGIKKILTDKRKRNRATQIVFLGYEFIRVSSGKSMEFTDLSKYLSNPYAMSDSGQ